MYDAAVENTFRNNRILSSGDAGVYLVGVSNNSFTGNVLQGNEFGVRLDYASAEVLSLGNQVQGNVISDNRQYGLYSQAPADANPAEGNHFSGNRSGDVRYPGQSLLNTGGKPVIQTIALFLVAVIVVVAIISPLAVHFRTKHRQVG